MRYFIISRSGSPLPADKTDEAFNTSDLHLIFTTQAKAKHYVAQSAWVTDDDIYELNERGFYLWLEKLNQCGIERLTVNAELSDSGELCCEGAVSVDRLQGLTSAEIAEVIDGKLAPQEHDLDVEIIYHCKCCGRVDHRAVDDPAPCCCGTAMTSAATSNIHSDSNVGSHT